MNDIVKTDIRSRVLVLVESAPNSTYAEFLCPDCSMPVAQLHNTVILGMTDVIDFDSRQAVLIGVPHKGRMKVGYCRTRYYFTLGEHS